MSLYPAILTPAPASRTIRPVAAKKAAMRIGSRKQGAPSAPPRHRLRRVRYGRAQWEVFGPAAHALRGLPTRCRSATPFGSGRSSSLKQSETAMIAFIDAGPEAKPHHGQILVTATSGGEKVQLLLTRHVANLLSYRVSAAVVAAFSEDTVFEPTPFTKKQRAKQGEG